MALALTFWHDQDDPRPVVRFAKSVGVVLDVPRSALDDETFALVFTNENGRPFERTMSIYDVGFVLAGPKTLDVTIPNSPNCLGVGARVWGSIAAPPFPPDMSGPDYRRLIQDEGRQVMRQYRRHRPAELPQWKTPRKKDQYPGWRLCCLYKKSCCECPPSE
jgi:hypothetical protein